MSLVFVSEDFRIDETLVDEIIAEEDFAFKIFFQSG